MKILNLGIGLLAAAAMMSCGDNTNKKSSAGGALNSSAEIGRASCRERV